MPKIDLLELPRPDPDPAIRHRLTNPVGAAAGTGWESRLD